LTVNTSAVVTTTLQAKGGLQATPIGNVTASTGQFTTVDATGNITDVALTSNGSITAGTTLRASGGLQATPIGNVTPSTAIFTSESVSGNSTVNALSVNASATIASSLGVGGATVISGNVGIGLAAHTGAAARYLHVGGAATSELHLTSTNSGGTATDGLVLQMWSDSTAYLWNREAAALSLGTGNAEKFRIDTNGNVGINTATPTFKLQVNGAFAATTKSFLIDHPTKEGMKLRYGSLEGPENGVYVRGRLTDNNVIELPDYWTGLVDENTITVNLTPVGKSQNLYVKDIVDNKVIVGGSKDINCFYTVFADRKDVDKLVVES
jgi:hypothetical protein